MNPKERARREWLYNHAEQAFHVEMASLVKKGLHQEASDFCMKGSRFLLEEEEALRKPDGPGRPGKSIVELMSIAAVICFADLLRKAHSANGTKITKAKAAEIVLELVKPHGLQGSTAVTQLENWSQRLKDLPPAIVERVELVVQNVRYAGRWDNQQAQILADGIDQIVNATDRLPGRPALPLTPENVIENLREAIEKYGLQVTYYAK